MSAEEHGLEQLRQASFAIAYRMLGSVSEAEDVVQEALLRVHQATESGEQIASPRVWSLDIAATEIRSIGSIVNPDKLAHLGVVADFAALIDAQRPRAEGPIAPQPPTHSPGGTP